MRIKIQEFSDSAEKPKSKRRKLRDHAEKLARVAREETRNETTSNISSSGGSQRGRRYPGGCLETSCGPDAACLPLNNNSEHSCVCPSNLDPPTEDLKCLGRNTVPLKPIPIHNVIPPPSHRNPDEVTKAFASSPTQQSPKSMYIDRDSDMRAETDPGFSMNANAGAVAAALGGIFLILLLAVILYFRRRMCCSRSKKTHPRILPGEPLLAERYITNPQYGVCTAGALAAALQVPAPAPVTSNEDPNALHVTLLDRKLLTLLEEVGEGCFGKVHKGLIRTATEEQIVAVKVLKESAGRSAEEDFVREVSIMSAFKHANILSLIGVVYTDTVNTSPWMVFEYMEWGDLAGVLRGSRHGGRAGPELDNQGLLYVALQVARGMQYLASRRFVHRDLAARNCLVGSQLSVKIADFGMSRDVYTSDYYKMGGERPMPVRWMSPESIVYARFTHESDVWSYGVVLWEIYSRGKQPFYGHNNEEASKLILRGIILVPPEDCPGFACKLMRACWETEPQNRISFDDICEKLEVAANTVDTPEVRLPRPPPLLQDAEGYLQPTMPAKPADYLIPLGDSDTDLASSEDESEEET